ncbi:putative RNA-binding protein [Ordospora colligata]|uniref:H/ACA ribonucleoprotein complex subunit n=1 Tax=Ordospora colligata OC4 TaxID=1354746 RepID=A0A0B2UHC5_9MICR|nr:putative RNA-binding protein [Ordospora colligata OC4]KHN70476.1 putative RNA-binding protein [Ordospora colligata OC4]TBU17226.1 putative RNA-binding protein [Ordospora colligata]TBU17476.1 putative RNA-binding protein [Ordospora colligata]TBU19656.1 putative RNA-binding protein [Ordospora colligata]
MARDPKGKRQVSTETTELGKVLYVCQEQLVLKLIAKDIPYPNSSVLDGSSKVIGKVDEVLGRMDDVHVTVTLSVAEQTNRTGQVLLAYADKFIAKQRFAARSEVEKKKEERDTMKAKSKRNGMERSREANTSKGSGERKPDGGWNSNKKDFRSNNNRNNNNNNRSNGNASSNNRNNNKKFTNNQNKRQSRPR